ncbi:MAG: response regulator [Eubacteriales bacterium]|nr:response regulator [Eubacteriales bacterium]
MFSLLIAEDEYLVRQGIRSLIDFEKYDISIIHEAEDGRSAWEIVQREQPDIVLSDINMPQINGIELSRLIKEAYPNTHIVFITGYDDFQYAVSALKIGADDYLLKPFSRSDVEQMLHQVTQKLKAEKRNRQVQELIEERSFTEIEQAIRDRLSDPTLTLKHLAEQLGFSAGHLGVLIKKELGISFQDYLIGERIKQAKLLLLTGEKKIYQIAEEVGIEDMNYFSQRFKQIVGVTPRQFRKGDTGE